jgi:hypothetical protein
MGFRLALTLNAPPFGLRRASLQPDPHRARALGKQSKARKSKEKPKQEQSKGKANAIKDLEWAK